MIVDRLVLHHTYEGQTAFDVSKHRHHGQLEHVSSGGGTVRFAGGPGCVRVPTSPELGSLRAVRTTVRFRWEPTGAPRRHNLIEGFLSFALVIEGNGALHGTILDRSGVWAGVATAGGVVQPGTWHTATFVHDGLSACRIDLDGVTIAEAFDTLGPARGVAAPYGVAIGHWPDPDDRYSFEGEIDDVRVWIDRPDAVREFGSAGCCGDAALVDEAFARVRADGLDAVAHRDAAEVLYDLGSRMFGQLASGGPADRDHAFGLARRFGLAAARGDRQGLGDVMGEATLLAQAKISSTELTAEADALVAALRPTLLGPVLEAAMSGGSASTPEGLVAVIEKHGLGDWMQGFCFDWAVPPPRKGRDKPRQHPDHSTDPATDHPPEEPGPSWGRDGQHDDGDDRQEPRR